MATTKTTPPADKAALRGETLPKEKARAVAAAGQKVINIIAYARCRI
jgi:hypothetical protein